MAITGIELQQQKLSFDVAPLCDLVRDRHGNAHEHVVLHGELGASPEHRFPVLVRRCTAN